jgi:hypothetical protein
MSNEGFPIGRQPVHEPAPAHSDRDLHAREREMLHRFEGYPNYDFRTAAEVNQDHGIDFIGEVIPRHLSRLRQSGSNRPVAVLDLGCGLGIFNDQIRQAFGSAVVVYGTTLLRESSEKKRMKFALRDHLRGRPDLLAVQEALQTMGPTMHPNDGKWRSVRELQLEPEFDVIVDTFGELYYSGRDIYSQNFLVEPFAASLEAAIQKLHFDGELYIGQLSDQEQRYVDSQVAVLREQFGTVFEKRKWHYTFHKVTAAAARRQS